MKGSRILITGGAGFIGSNLANHLVQAGHDVVILDNFYRKGVRHNIRWLKDQHADGFQLIEADLRNYDAVERACEGAQVVYHIGGQTAVTTSVEHPREDVEINLLGTFNALEAARLVGDNPVFIFTSTNKVYGGMEDVAIAEEDTQYSYSNGVAGMNENRPLDFHSPYGCSKGAADQYVRDYARIYGLDTVVFRMSSIYGPRQFGIEDQAWVAFFAIAAVTGRPFNIYGDGKQVRDVLYIDDLIQAFELATENIDITRGQIYNIGGGPSNALSIWLEFGPILARVLGSEVKPNSFGSWRPGDQKVYISDISKAKEDFGWEPTVGLEQGLTTLVEWVRENQQIL